MAKSGVSPAARCERDEEKSPRGITARRFYSA